MKEIRWVKKDDLPIIAELMHQTLEPYYDGDHRAHAKRIVETASERAKDLKGHFSAAQLMYVATENEKIIGILNFVAKYQGTVKISPLIVHEEARGQGVSSLLLEKLDEYVKEHRVRQIYCTVSLKNATALSFFLSRGYVKAGTASCHYKSNTDEVMLYKIIEDEGCLPEERTISVLPLIKEDETKLTQFIIDQLSPYFDGIDTRWTQALFDGYARRNTRDPNEKYKIIWVAKSYDGNILGVAAATPKKGEPIKLMPLIASEIQAYWALIAELPTHLNEYGHKLYTHIVPTSVEVEMLQLHGWRVEGMLPDAYKIGVVTQQWGLVLEDKVMKVMRVKYQYYQAIMSGTKPLEVRVGYDNIRKLKKNDLIQLESGRHSSVIEIVDVRVYKTFVEMLKRELAEQIVPDNPTRALAILEGIYPKEKEALGVYVFQFKIVKK